MEDMPNCEICGDKGFTESAYCLMTYHVHGWISRYDKKRGSCTTPCECGFDPEDEELVEEEERAYDYIGEDWAPSWDDLRETRRPFGPMRDPNWKLNRFRLQLQFDTLVDHTPKGYVTSDKDVWGLCEETGRTARVPKWLAGEPVEFEKYGADMQGKLLVRYTFMESHIHVLFTGYQLEYFRFAHPWDDTYETKELM